jgi:hypothetical protein
MTDLIDSRPVPNLQKDTTAGIEMLRSQGVPFDGDESTTLAATGLDGLQCTIRPQDAPPPPEPVEIVPLWVEGTVLVVGVSGDPTPAQLAELNDFGLEVRIVRSTEAGIRQAMDEAKHRLR